MAVERVQTLTSTTNSAEQVQAALADPPPVRADVVPATPAKTDEDPARPASDEPPAAAATPAAATETPAAADEDDDDLDEDGPTEADASAAGATLAKRKARAKTRIRQLTKEKNELLLDSTAKIGERDRKIEDLSREIAALKAKPTGDATPPAQAEGQAPPSAAATAVVPDEDQPQPEPKLDDFESIEDYTRAHGKWNVLESKREDRLAARKREHDASVEQAFTEAKVRLGKSVEESRQRHDDWDDVKAAAAEIRMPTELAMEIQDSEVAGELMYHFAKHPAELEEVMQLGPRRGLKRLGQIEAKVRDQIAPPAAAAEPAKPAAVARPVAVSRAPAPVTTVGGGSTATSRKLDEMDYQSFKKARAAGAS
jgi:hypothetical protein